MIKVKFESTEVELEEGIKLKDFINQYVQDHPYLIVAAKVNNEIKDLNYKLHEDCKLSFIDLSSEQGVRIYRKSLLFIMIKSSEELYPQGNVVVRHSLSKGLYCEIKNIGPMTEEIRANIEKKMKQTIEAKIPFDKKEISVSEAIELYKKEEQLDKASILQYRSKGYVTIYSCGDWSDYFYGYLLPDSGYVNKFELKLYENGLLLRYPHYTNPNELPPFAEQKKLFNIFKEYKKWNEILEIENIAMLNDIIKENKINEYIRITEALQEKKIGYIADMIASNESKKVVLIAGPSSSGKTTFANRLAIQLRANGLKPLTVSIDDYFVDREHTPRDAQGNFDFESIEAIDLPLFNTHLSDLIEGKEVELPIFNFHLGRREDVGKRMRMQPGQILVMEGIHGLNDRLTSSISKDNKFKIYVSALTSLSIDDHNVIPTTDTRILRRIVRDNQFRGHDAIKTISMWTSVRRGEEENIFPFQESADIMFNSATIFELSVLKGFAEPLLEQITNSYEEYSEARRLLEFLAYFLPIDPTDIPKNSLIREFIGGSCFY